MDELIEFHEIEKPTQEEVPWPDDTFVDVEPWRDGEPVIQEKREIFRDYTEYERNPYYLDVFWYLTVLCAIGGVFYLIYLGIKALIQWIF